MKYAYNYYAIDIVTGEEIAWGTFKSTSALDKDWELADNAKHLAYAFFMSHDVRVEIRECDPTSYKDISATIASYTTKENS